MSYRFWPGELRGQPLTPHQEDVMVAVVNEGGLHPAARSLGITHWTVAYILAVICDKLGAKTTTHAAALLYRQLGNRYRPKG